MTEQQRDSNRLFTTKWVRLFEEDTSQGEVYAADDGHIPLSRRPRPQLSLQPDGSATAFVPGPDDRLTARQARWVPHDPAAAPRGDAPQGELRILHHSPTRLIVMRLPTAK